MVVESFSLLLLGNNNNHRPNVVPSRTATTIITPHYDHPITSSSMWMTNQPTITTTESSSKDDDTMSINNNNKNDEEEEEDGWYYRFGGVGRLLSSSSSSDEVVIRNRLKNATVAVVGIGGVGSWVAEALCRSGIGHLVLVDLDDICISNTNRQLHAMSSTVGQMKTDIMKQRLLDIHPQCNITILHDFVTVENVNEIVDKERWTVCVDAIDGQKEKTALIAACCICQIPIVTCGGAAGRTDPTKVVCDDLTRATECRLLFRCRKSLRDEYQLFPKGPAQPKSPKFATRKWRIPTIYSTEIIPKQPNQQSPQSSSSSSFRTCDGALGTACYVTGTFGFVAASKVIEMISSNHLPVPRSFKKPRTNTTNTTTTTTTTTPPSI